MRTASKTEGTDVQKPCRRTKHCTSEGRRRGEGWRGTPQSSLGPGKDFIFIQSVAGRRQEDSPTLSSSALSSKEKGDLETLSQAWRKVQEALEGRPRGGHRGARRQAPGSERAGTGTDTAPGPGPRNAKGMDLVRDAQPWTPQCLLLGQPHPLSWQLGVSSPPNLRAGIVPLRGTG